ncbi:MAG: hydrogenase maturation nickel metallochaperone HypA [Archangiaceae bacterium]|nr:hydrogenase maturation nickel metallochaperone HypA [Archangiaceae bacterium]
MHEYSIVSSLIDRAEAEAKKVGATSIANLTVRIGDQSGVDARLLSIAWETFRERTLCAGARLDIERVPAVWKCPRCGAAPAPGGPLRCFPCNQPARLVAGDELVLAHLELEVPDHV